MRARMWSWVAVLLASSCVRSAPTPRAPAPVGWWVVESARRPADEDEWPAVATLGVPGAVWRFEDDEVQAVRPGYVVDRIVLRVAGTAGQWHVGAGGEGEDACTLQGGVARIELRCARGDLAVSFRPALPDETTAAEVALTQHGTPEATCARARACSEGALRVFPYLGDYAPRGAPDLRRCEQSLVVFTRQFHETRRPLPAACAR